MHFLARFFRSSNAVLLQSYGTLWGRALKIIYLVSVRYYMRWVRHNRNSQIVQLDNCDGNIKIKLDISKRMGAVIFWTGYHEFNELRYLHSYFKPEMVFVDVGANQGEFSLFAAKRLPTGKVYAFEPVGDFFSMLKENISLNKFANIEPWKLGLSDKAGSFPIYFDSDHKNQNEGIASLFALPDQQVKETIETITLDSFCSNNQITKVDVIKIDVEGAEFQVLKGSEQVLRNSKPLLMVELSEVNFKAAGYTSKELVGWVTSLGYKMYLIKKGRLIQTNSHPEFCNVIFIHQA